MFKTTHVRTIRRTALLAICASALCWVGCGDSSGEQTRDTGGTVADTGSDTGVDDTGVADTGVDDSGPEDTGEGGDTAEETWTPDTAEDADGGRDADGTTDTDGGSSSAMIVSTVDYSNEEARVATVVGDAGQIADDKTYQTKDLILDSSRNHLYALNRFCSGFGEQESCSRDAGIVEKLTVASDGSLQVERTLQLPTGVYNPHGTGVAPAGGETFVSSYFTSSIYVYDGSGQTPTTSIDVSPFEAGGNDTDQDPEPSDIAVEGNRVYVVLLRLTGFQPEVNSVIVGYDAQSDSLIDMNPNTNTMEALDLGAGNAFAGIDRTPSGGWTVALTGQWSDDNQDPVLDGRIVRLQPESNGRLSVGDTLVDESTLDGNINAYRMVSDNRGFAVVSKGRSSRVVEFDAGQSSPSVSEVATDASTLCTTTDHAEVWVGKSSSSSQSFVGYDASTGDALSDPSVDVSRSPTSCRFVELGG